MQNIPEPIFSKSMTAGNKTYFFDVKQAQGGKQSKYMQITETRTQDGQRLRNSITIFPNHLGDFTLALEEAKTKVS